MQSFFESLETSALAGIVRQSAWLYPGVEIIHILGFALLVGAAFLFDLRLLGFARKLPVTACVSHMIFWARISLIAVIPSGLTLFMVNAATISGNPAFRIKLVLMGLAGINALIFHRFTMKSVSEWNMEVKPPLPATAAGILSMILWTGVIAGGRLIAYT